MMKAPISVPSSSLAVVLFLAVGLLAACRPVSAPIAQAAPSQAFVPILEATPSSFQPLPTLPATPTPTRPVPTFSPIPSLTPTPDLSCSMEGGRMVIGKLDPQQLSQPLPEALEYRVYLPPCYDQNTSQRYPVLYLIHGQSYTDDQWDRLGADELADEMIPAGELPPFLIVMPRDRVWSEPDQDGFGEAVVRDLILWIDAHYRTLPDRQHRAIGGLSRGGGWAVHLGLSNWQLFGAIGTHSLAVFYTDTKHIRTWLDAIPHDELPRIYIDIGNNDRPEIMSSAVWFEQILTQKDIPHEWHLFSGYHEEKYWQAHLKGYLKWYAAEW